MAAEDKEERSANFPDLSGGLKAKDPTVTVSYNISNSNNYHNSEGYNTANAHHYIDILHRLGFKTAALALTDKTISIDDPVLKSEEKLAIILGNEGNGLLPETISKSDYVVKIPMPDGIDSLNVAAASAVAFWELRK